MMVVQIIVKNVAKQHTRRDFMPKPLYETRVGMHCPKLWRKQAAVAGAVTPD